MPKHILIILLTLIATSLSWAQEPQLFDPGLQHLFKEELSGELAKDHVIQITRFHRIQGSRQYREAAQYVLAYLRSHGFGGKEASIESFVSDGKATYQTWQSPSGWDISSAYLTMVEPYEERIVSYPDVAMSVMTYSNAGDVTAELVWVGDGTGDADYTGKNVADKFVLATGYGGDVHREAVLKYHAKAVVCFLDDDRAKEHPDMLQYTGMWPRTNELAHVTFGFNITNRQGTKLRDLLISGKRVVLHGTVNGTGLEPYFMDVVSAVIHGTGEGEIDFTAHLDHPKESANDNASGSGAILDLATTLRRLIDNNQLPKPVRTLRFLCVPEWYGTMAYIDAHPELKGVDLGGSVLANLNLDMVGENLGLLHSILYLTRTPSSVPSVLNDVMANMAAMADRTEIRTPRGSESPMNYRLAQYEGGSDHMMFIDRRVPGVMFTHSDYTHHTSDDTPDKVDPVELQRCELIAGAAGWYLANVQENEAYELLYLAREGSKQRLAVAAWHAHDMAIADPSPTGYAEAVNVLNHASEWERKSVASVLSFYRSHEVEQRADLIGAEIERDASTMLAELGTEPPGADRLASPADDPRIPTRLSRGPLDFGLPASRLTGSDSLWYSSAEFTLTGDERFELVNFIDGQRSVSEIRDCISAEFTPVPREEVSRYVSDLVKVGVVGWK